MFTNKPIAVLYLDRGFLLYYDSSRHDILQLDFSALSTNVEVTKRDELEAVINNFIVQNKLLGGELYIILAESTLFLKGLAPDIVDIDAEVKRFTDNTPFEHVITKSYSIDVGKLLISTNKDYFESIARVFERHGFFLMAVVPVFATGVDFSSGFTQAIAQKLANSNQSLKENSFDLDIKPPPAPKLIGVEMKKPDKKSEKKRLLILSIVFGVLIVILITVYFMNQEPPRAVSPNPQNTSPVVTLTPAPQRTSQSVEVTKTPEALHIKIITSSTSISKADTIKAELEKNGFENIEEVLNNNPTTENTIITFAPSVASSIRDQITTIFKDTPGVISQENQIENADISITLPIQ